jgi:sulfofructose kinase
MTDELSKIPRSRPRLVMVGLSCLDHIWQLERFPPDASRTTATAYRMQGGGPAATAAVTAARLGAEVSLVALHGDDANGRAAREELEHYGVDCTHLRVVPGGVSWVSAVLVAPGGERFIFPYRGAGLIDSAEGLDGALLGGVDCLLCDGRHPLMSRALLEEARRRGVPTVGDWSNTRHWELTKLIDYLLVSEECAREVLGRDDPEAALEKLRQVEGQVVGITLGEQGFLFDDGERVRHLSALPVEAVDTTGAGDVFHGAYAYAVARGESPERCGLFASVTAALSVTALGRSGIPTASEVEHLLEKKTLKEMNELQWT